MQHLPFKQVVVIGAGLSGLDMGCALKRKLDFHEFIIFDRNPSMGGTWYDNNYPGCAIDIPGCIFQFSYAPETNFPTVFPNRAEMLSYMDKVADKFGVHQHMRFNMSWKGSTWLEDSQVWRIELEDLKTGESFVQECKVLISAIGHQIDPKDFSVEGMEQFKGQIVASSRYPETLDLKGKDVVVLGNGSTAVQVVPGILDDVKRLTQIQKDPHWILHRPNPPVPRWLRSFWTKFPIFFSMLKYTVFACIEAFFFLLGSRLSTIAAMHQRRCQVPEKYRKLLTPSYTPGCRRMVFTPDYLPCLKNPKLKLAQDQIVSLKESSVVTKSGNEYPADVLILCHGFKADSFWFPVTGRNGLTLAQHWDIAGGPCSYKGCAMSGFPNFFMLRGPHLASGQQTTTWFIEASTELILNVAKPLIRGQAEVIEVDETAEMTWVQRVQAACKRGFWGRDCHTYYVTDSGWNHTIYPWSSYWLWFHRFINKGHWIVTPSSKASS